MDERELYRKKMQAQLDEWQADMDKMRARAAKASVDAQLEMREQIKMVEALIKEGQQSLVQVAEAGEDAWDAVKSGIDSAWNVFRASMSEARQKFRDKDKDKD